MGRAGAVTMAVLLGGCSLVTDADEYTFGRGDPDAAVRDAGADGGGESDAGRADAGPFASAATYIAAGGSSTCARLDSGSLVCWGANESGQLGRGDLDPHADIAAVAGLLVTDEAVRPVAVGPAHACAIARDTSLWCWGSNAAGQLGHTAALTTAPAMVAAVGLGWTHVAAGGTTPETSFTCGVNGDLLYCWGANARGQLGAGDMTPRALPVPVLSVTPIDAVVDLATGGAHACAILLESGAVVVRCWGANDRGQLGDGSESDRSTPVQVGSIGAGTAALAAGALSTCAWVSGSVSCWGDGSSFHLGNTFTPFFTTAPTSLVSPSPRAPTPVELGSIDLAEETTFVVTFGGGVEAWGYDGAERLLGGEPTTGARPFPDAVAFADGLPAVQVAAGAQHACVLASGRVFCWGSNAAGQAAPAAGASVIAPPQELVLPGP